jgi:hypothetical protein
LARGANVNRTGRERARDAWRRYQLVVDGQTFVIQGEPERRDPDRLVWSLDLRPA